ncbi:hypothetical protein BA903_11150 [Klebsiella pneumoniae]|nr:hypothetical protein BA903_11150 [Klebsiella pneumoniae]
MISYQGLVRTFPIHLGMTSLITADIITIVTNKSNELLTKIDT